MFVADFSANGIRQGYQPLAKNTTTRNKRPRRPDSAEKFTSKEYAPYVLAIGQVALAWNDLHEMLGTLFRQIMGDELDDKLIHVWQSAPFDRPKRAMLEAAVLNISEREAAWNPKASEDVIWLLRRVDALEEDRNNAIHAPLQRQGGLVSALFGYTEGIIAEDVWGNKRAAKLKGKDLLTEYRYCRDAAFTLRDYAEAIYDAWSFGRPRRHAWPDRPSLPNRGQKNLKKAPNRQSNPTQLPLLLKPTKE